MTSIRLTPVFALSLIAFLGAQPTLPGAAQATAPGNGAEARITYEDVLSQPDNLRLSFDFTKQEVRDGEVLSALSTLERILQINPDLADVRFFYAVLLYRLDNLAEAGIQLALIDEEQLSADLKGEVAHYRNLIAEAGDPLKANVTASLGYRYDTNRNAATDGDGLFFDLPVNFVAEPEGDTSRLGHLTGRIEYDLGLNRPFSVYASGSAFLNQPSTLDEQSFLAFSAESGAITRYSSFDITLRSFGQHLTQDKEDHLSLVGFGLRVDHQIKIGTDAYVEGRAQHEIYHDSEASPTNSTHNGERYRLAAGIIHAFAPDFSVGLSVYGERKDSDAVFETFWRKGFQLNGFYLPGQGQYISLNLYMESDDYDESDPLVTSQIIRRDLTRGFSLTYGLPAATLVGWLDTEIGKAMPESLGLSLTLDGRSRRSNIPNYEVRNWGVQSLVTYRLAL